MKVRIGCLEVVTFRHLVEDEAVTVADELDNFE